MFAHIDTSIHIDNQLVLLLLLLVFVVIARVYVIVIVAVCCIVIMFAAMPLLWQPVNSYGRLSCFYLFMSCCIMQL